MVKCCKIIRLRSREYTYRALAQRAGVSIGMIHYKLEQFREFGPAGLFGRRGDNGSIKVDEDFLSALREDLEHLAAHYEWSRPTWTIEMLIVTLYKKTGVKVNRSTIGRALGLAWLHNTSNPSGSRPAAICLKPGGPNRDRRRFPDPPVVRFESGTHSSEMCMSWSRIR